MLKPTWASDRCFNCSLMYDWRLVHTNAFSWFSLQGTLLLLFAGDWGCSSVKRCSLAFLNPGLNLQHCINQAYLA